MATFPLLQLPLVAMENVLWTMSPFELNEVSMASTRAKGIVKNFSRSKNKFSVEFSNQGPSLSFRGKQNRWTLRMTTNKGSAGFFQFREPDNVNLIVKHSTFPMNDIKKWFDYAKEVLYCEIDKVTFDFDFSRWENIQTIDWLAGQGGTLNKLEVLKNNADSNAEVKDLLERIHITGSLKLMGEFQRDFQMEIPGKPAFLRIQNAQFINYDQFLRLKSPVIILWKSIITSQEINRFLNSWMSCETHLELEKFQINVSGPDAVNEIMDLPHERTNDPNLIHAFEGYPHSIRVVNEMFTIEKSDGKKKATVTVGQTWSGWHFNLIVH
uniref:F-box domain-containing protein n=1 Tax=Caenorhabditis tropicalis TaxID=1561998 RepID=A0A1I7UU15_9PELO